MNASHFMALIGRMLIILGLVAISFGTPAMASGKSADCVSMMQDGGQMSKTMPDMGKQCPYVAFCAVSGLYVKPTPPTDYTSVAVSDALFLPVYDSNGVGLASSPPIRPPRF